MLKCTKCNGVTFIRLCCMDELLLFLQFDLCSEMKYAKQLRGIKKF